MKEGKVSGTPVQSSYPVTALTSVGFAVRCEKEPIVIFTGDDFLHTPEKVSTLKLNRQGEGHGN